MYDLGGGSALLPSPHFPLTLEEKQRVIRLLFSKGAAIEEINVVRKKLSKLKGGGLAKLAKPAQVSKIFFLPPSNFLIIKKDRQR